MKNNFVIMSFIFILGLRSAGGSETAADWAKRLQQRLAEFESCKDKADDASPCNRFVGQALADVYGISDLKGTDGQYLSANLVEAYVVTSKNWVSLGKASDQQVLQEAATAAGQGRAVIAIKVGNPHGHVAIILPGDLTASSNWKLNVPNSASFFLDKPDNAYVGDKLSKAFSSPDGVKIFAYSS